MHVERKRSVIHGRVHSKIVDRVVVRIDERETVTARCERRLVCRSVPISRSHTERAYISRISRIAAVEYGQLLRVISFYALQFVCYKPESIAYRSRGYRLIICRKYASDVTVSCVSRAFGHHSHHAAAQREYAARKRCRLRIFKIYKSYRSRTVRVHRSDKSAYEYAVTRYRHYRRGIYEESAPARCLESVCRSAVVHAEYAASGKVSAARRVYAVIDVSKHRRVGKISRVIAYDCAPYRERRRRDIVCLRSRIAVESRHIIVLRYLRACGDRNMPCVAVVCAYDSAVNYSARSTYVVGAALGKRQVFCRRALCIGTQNTAEYDFRLIFSDYLYRSACSRVVVNDVFDTAEVHAGENACRNVFSKRESVRSRQSRVISVNYIEVSYRTVIDGDKSARRSDGFSSDLDPDVSAASRCRVVARPVILLQDIIAVITSHPAEHKSMPVAFESLFRPHRDETVHRLVYKEIFRYVARLRARIKLIFARTVDKAIELALINAVVVVPIAFRS